MLNEDKGISDQRLKLTTCGNEVEGTVQIRPLNDNYERNIDWRRTVQFHTKAPFMKYLHSGG